MPHAEHPAGLWVRHRPTSRACQHLAHFARLSPHQRAGRVDREAHPDPVGSRAGGGHLDALPRSAGHSRRHAVSTVGDNPRRFPDAADQEQVWVVYPFIHGTAYAGASSEIRAAGALLGRIHAVGMHHAFGLKVSETVVPIAADEVAHDTDAIVQRVAQAFPDRAAAARALLLERTQRYVQDVLPRLLALRLPLTNASWDYKASNLVYAPDGGPVLVDPDNAGRIPRTYDLAIATLLFHNEAGEPGRVFSAPEWHTFVEGYAQHVRLSAEELSVWDDVLLCAWIDEALWLLREDEAGWSDRRQSGMLMSLLSTPLTSFALAR